MGLGTLKSTAWLPQRQQISTGSKRATVCSKWGISHQGQPYSTLPFQKPQDAECPEKSKDRTDKTTAPLPTCFITSHKDLTKSVIKVYKIIRLSTATLGKKNLKGEQVPALSTKLKVTGSSTELTFLFHNRFLAKFKPFSKTPSIDHSSQDTYEFL